MQLASLPSLPRVGNPIPGNRLSSLPCVGALCRCLWRLATVHIWGTVTQLILEHVHEDLNLQVLRMRLRSHKIYVKSMPWSVGMA